MQRIATPLAAAILATATVIAPHSSPAQRPLRPVRVVGGANALADSTHQAALRYDSSPRRYRKAAEMHRRSAAMRGAGDAQAVDCLLRAGRMLYYAGELDGAQDALTAAGERAQLGGDVVAAANAFLDAGFVARELRRPHEATALGARAVVLAGSPLLSQSQRTAITSRTELASAASGAATTADARSASRGAPR